eukprot:749330-Rhodomonas_salina.1
MLSLYVDDGMSQCASSSLELYDHCDRLRQGGRCGQEKYMETLLELFNMLGCKPETTPFEPGGHLL